jgi:membrane fusion protein, multidrug efflux system
VLWPNAFVKARLLLDVRKGALVIPAVAVQRGPQGTFVYVATGAGGENAKAELRPVTVDLLEGDQALIGKGLTDGESVVIEGQNQLRPGSKIVARTSDSGGGGAGAAGAGGGKRGRKGGGAGQGGAATTSADSAGAPAGHP